jgi:hypothetical protein
MYPYREFGLKLEAFSKKNKKKIRLSGAAPETEPFSLRQNTFPKLKRNTKHFCKKHFLKRSLNVENSMDNTKQEQANQERKNGSVRVTKVGWVCVYCGAETEDLCCGEVHHEIGYETQDGELILESELTEIHEIIA